MSPTHSRTPLILLFVTLVAGCGFNKPEYLKTISADSLYSTIYQRDIVLIDVHIPEQSHIIGTDLFAPFHKIDDYLKHLPADKNTAIYLYCKTGHMANWAARTLFEKGYTNIYNLEGGTKAWYTRNLSKQNK